MQFKSAARMRRMSAFEFWLRTGRLVDAPYLLVDIETKFNQRHYAENGQFARVGEGQLYGPGSSAFRGGGGQSGGGGATGSWPAPVRSKPKQPAKVPVKPLPSTALHARQQLAPAVRPQIHQTIIRNNYRFAVDAERRTHVVTGQLHTTPTPVRSRRVQRQAGGTDRLPSDDGGHFIAARFNGPRDKFNHFAQDANFNRGAYRELENRWARAMARGEQVRVTINVSYEGSSQRPSEISVSWRAGKRIGRKRFINKKGRL